VTAALLSRSKSPQIGAVKAAAMRKAQPLLADENVDSNANNPGFNCPDVVGACQWYITNNQNTPDDNRQRRCQSLL
jgi:hypothetical protein